MDITFRTVGPWGPGKGANLQAAEVDNNFWELVNHVLNIENNPVPPNGIQSITISGTQMTIVLTDGTIMGPYTIPVLVMRWRDEWLPNTPYVQLDVVSVTNVGIFMCTVNHTSGDTFDPNLIVGGEAVWLQLFGSTDVTLGGLTDVYITDLLDNDFLTWRAADEKWVNRQLGTMAYQDNTNVSISGGIITGMGSPSGPSDVVNKAYVDSLPAGMTSPNATMMSNIVGVGAPAVPNTLSDFLDYVLGTSTRGTMLYRGGSGWAPLAPGTSGQFLKTLGGGVDPVWAAAGAGVTSITAGSGIAASPNPIVATGTLALAAIANQSLLANISGTTVAPSATTLSALLDAVMSSARGSILMRAGGGWVALAPGTSGYFLKTQGPTADPVWDSPAGAGTVTSVAAGAGLTASPSPITGAGTISLTAVADKSLLANTSGSSAAPIGTTASLYFDGVFGATQGGLVYRNASTWVSLSPGTSGQVLTTGGAAANPSWAAVPASAPIGTGLILGNISGSSAAAIGLAPSAVFDAVFGSARGMVLYRGASGWAALTVGTAGQVLTSGGTAADPSWTTPAAGGGASITIGDTLPPSASPGDAHWDSASGQLFIFYNDGTSSQWVIANSTMGTAAAPKYLIGFSFTGGVLAASQLLGLHRVAKAITIPANFASYAGYASQAGATANATASTVISLDRAVAATPNSFSQIGTITIAAGGITASFATSGGTAVNVAQGDVLRLLGPATADATLANFYATLVAQEQ